MCILTGTGIRQRVVAVDAACPGARAVYHVRRPLPQYRATLVLRGQSITYAVTRRSYQITIPGPAALARARAHLAALFYGGALPPARVRFTNLNCAIAVAEHYALDIGLLRDAVAAGKCPGIALKQCSRPRHAASRILYLVCAQPGARKRRRVTIIASERRVTIIGVCDMRAVAYVGAIRRLLAASGAFVGPHAFVDHREALWPAIGARLTPDVEQTLAYIAAYPVDENPSIPPAP